LPLHNKKTELVEIHIFSTDLLTLLWIQFGAPLVFGIINLGADLCFTPVMTGVRTEEWDSPWIWTSLVLEC